MELLLHLEEVLMYNHSLKGGFRGSLETQREPGYLDFFLCFYSVDTTTPPGHPTLTTTPDHLLPAMGLRSLSGGSRCEALSGAANFTAASPQTRIKHESSSIMEPRMI